MECGCKCSFPCLSNFYTGCLGFTSLYVLICLSTMSVPDLLLLGRYFYFCSLPLCFSVINPYTNHTDSIQHKMKKSSFRVKCTNRHSKLSYWVWKVRWVGWVECVPSGSMFVGVRFTAILDYSIKTLKLVKLWKSLKKGVIPLTPMAER